MRALLAAAAGFCHRIDRDDDVRCVLDGALAHIAGGSSPAVLLIAKDRQCAKSAGGGERESAIPAPSIPQLPFAAVQAAARELSSGSCVIIAGEEVLRGHARTELAAIAEALDASVAVAPDARDAFDNYDPRFLGVAGAMGHERVVAALEGARSCLLVGTRLSLLTRMGLEQRLNEIACVSFGREAPFLASKADTHFECEVRGGLRLLAAALRDAPSMSKPRGAVPERAATANCPSRELGFAPALAAIERAMDDDSIVIADAGNTGASVVHFVRAPRKGRWLNALGMAGMGYAFGAAIGAAFASGRRCWVFAGDGAFYMHGLEIHTAVEHALPITFVIFDNRAHGMCLVREQLLLRENGGYNSFRSVRLAAGLAAMFPGLQTRDCADIPQLEEALRSLESVRGPSVIVLRLETVEVPPFVAFQKLDPTAKTVSRGGTDAPE
jgi:acetolactate synthase-1/2/3 large subunit